MGCVKGPEDSRQVVFAHRCAGGICIQLCFGFTVSPVGTLALVTVSPMANRKPAPWGLNSELGWVAICLSFLPRRGPMTSS